MELVFLLLAIAAVSAWWLPDRYQQRMEQNEKGAHEVLQMILSAQQCWHEERGRWAPLGLLAEAPDADLDQPSSREALLPFLRAGSLGRAYYGGYLFEELRDSDGRPLGVEARPNLADYSGRTTWRLSYDSGEIRIFSEGRVAEQ